MVQFLNVTTTYKLGTESASVSFNKFKLMLSSNPVISMYLLYYYFYMYKQIDFINLCF